MLPQSPAIVVPPDRSTKVAALLPLVHVAAQIGSIDYKTLQAV
jgi:hypothetical protein